VIAPPHPGLGLELPAVLADLADLGDGDPTVIDRGAPIPTRSHAAVRRATPAPALVTPDEQLGRAALDAAAARLPAGAGPVELVATPTVATIVQIVAALEARRPLILHHARLTEPQRARQSAIARATVVPDDTLAVVFTSGSTGEPRPIALGRQEAFAAAEASAAHLGWRDDDAWLLALPLAHVGGLAIVLRCLAARRPIALATASDPAAIAAFARSARTTLASLVPTQLAALLEQPAFPPPALRAALLGGARAPRALRERAAGRGVPILTTYGLTETWGQVVTQPLARAGTVDDAIGVPLPGVSITAGRHDAPSRVVIRGPMCRGSVTTADLGHVDARGWLHLAGRADDVIITGGENVHPLAVEDVVAEAPGVADACVVGVDDPRWGQRIVAMVVAEAGASLEPVIAYARSRLAPHQLPREWHTVAALPRTATGKLDRRAVLDGIRRG
jgi:O-succinylbenzoic acid--CoA ligase